MTTYGTRGAGDGPEPKDRPTIPATDHLRQRISGADFAERLAKALASDPSLDEDQ